MVGGYGGGLEQIFLITMASRIADHRDDCFGAGQGAQRAPTLMTCWSGLFQPSGLKTREVTTRDQSLAKDTVNNRHL